MKNKPLKIVVLLTIIVLLILVAFTVRHKLYNNIGDDWLFTIRPNYFSQPFNEVLIYEDSYIITKSFITRDWQDWVYKRGKLTKKVDENLIEKIKEEASKTSQDISLNYIVKMKNGEKLTITHESEALKQIEEMINHQGTIWYVN